MHQGRPLEALEKMNDPEKYIDRSEDNWWRRYDRLRAASEVGLARHTATFLQQNKQLARRYDPSRVQKYYADLQEMQNSLYSN